MGPLSLLLIIYGRKRKHTKWDSLLIVLLLLTSAGMSLSACKRRSNNNPAPAPNSESTSTSTSEPEEPPLPTAQVTIISAPTTEAATQPPATAEAPVGNPEDETTVCTGEDCLSQKFFDKLILICGIDNLSCANGTAPLHPFRKWAERNGYSSSDFNIFDVESGYHPKEAVANLVQNKIDSTPDARFLLVGHSAGADSVIIASSNTGNKDKIAGIALLDPYMWASEYGDLQTLANNIPGNKFVADTRFDYRPDTDNDNKLVPIIVTINGAKRKEYDYGANSHKEIALDNQVVTDMVKAFEWNR